MTREPVLLISANSAAELSDKLAVGECSTSSLGAFRLAIIGPTPERLLKAKELLNKGQACRGIQGIWLVFAGLLKGGGKLAFMYPGIDSLARPNVKDVAEHFAMPSEELGGGGEKAAALESRGAEVFHTSDLFTKVTRKLGVVPSAIFGHSLGEWSAAVACGLTLNKTVAEVISALQPGMLPVPGTVFAALGCGAERAREICHDISDVQISHENCPHQSILCGMEEAIDQALNRLKEEKIMCQKLDFRSGFHTSFFKPYIGPLEQMIRKFSFGTPHIPMWSATTCEPYPNDVSAVRELMLQHLVEPVRFQQLTKKLYEDGYRVFVQVGAGSLPGFINDTLRGRPHLALSTTVANRSGMVQLQRFCVELFAEGADFDLSFLLGSKPVKSDLMMEMDCFFKEVQCAVVEIAEALKATKPFKKRISKEVSLQMYPELMDHSFYKQKIGWQNVSDLFPVVPMTGSVDLIMKMAVECFPGYKVIAVENIAATKWLSVEVPLSLEIEMTYDGKNRLKMDLIGHFSATLVISKNYSEVTPPLASQLPLLQPRSTGVLAENLYKEGWLFHGPAFQGIVHIGSMGDNGIEGRISARGIPGALLDNGGQLAGLWIMKSVNKDRYAMPIKIKRIEFFSPEPKEGEVECQVRVVKVRPRDILLNFEMICNGQIWARIEGWETWRFECDDRLWSFLMTPGRSMISETPEPSKTYTWLERKDLTSEQCNDLSRRYLREAERQVYSALGKKKEAWICGRVAAKDAIRNYLWKSGYSGDIFPAEIWLDNDSLGRPLVREAPGGKDLYLSISHKSGLGVACVSESSHIGIDIELVEDRPDSFTEIALSPSEIKMLPSASQALERAEWITRLWGAKEAFAKSTGLGLQGDPKKIRIIDFVQDRIRVEDRWIKSEKVGTYIVSQIENVSASQPKEQ